MVSNYTEKKWFQLLTKAEKQRLEALVAAQYNQGDMDPLRGRLRDKLTLTQVEGMQYIDTEARALESESQITDRDKAVI